MIKYAGSPYTKIERPVQKIVVIVPVDEEDATTEVEKLNFQDAGVVEFLRGRNVSCMNL